MERDEAEKVRALLHYPEDTAGGRMTMEYVSVYNYYTVEEVIQYFAKRRPRRRPSIMCMSSTRRPAGGGRSLRELLISPPDTPVVEVMFERIISVTADMDQEVVARLIERYDFLALPVVDVENRLLGIITIDDMVDVLIEEAHEDISNFRRRADGNGCFDPSLCICATSNSMVDSAIVHRHADLHLAKHF